VLQHCPLRRSTPSGAPRKRGTILFDRSLFAAPIPSGRARPAFWSRRPGKRGSIFVKVRQF
jgi:hypothetical protein